MKNVRYVRLPSKASRSIHAVKESSEPHQQQGATSSRGVLRLAVCSVVGKVPSSRHNQQMMVDGGRSDCQGKTLEGKARRFNTKASLPGELTVHLAAKRAPERRGAAYDMLVKTRQRPEVEVRPAVKGRRFEPEDIVSHYNLRTVTYMANAQYTALTVASHWPWKDDPPSKPPRHRRILQSARLHG